MLWGARDPGSFFLPGAPSSAPCSCPFLCLLDLYFPSCSLIFHHQWGNGGTSVSSYAKVREGGHRSLGSLSSTSEIPPSAPLCLSLLSSWAIKLSGSLLYLTLPSLPWPLSLAATPTSLPQGLNRLLHLLGGGTGVGLQETLFLGSFFSKEPRLVGFIWDLSQWVGTTSFEKSFSLFKP